MAIEPKPITRPSRRNLIRGLCALGLGLAAIGLGAGCGSSQDHAQPAVQPGSTAANGQPASPQAGLAATCQTALTQYASLQQDLSRAVANPSDPATAKRLDSDAEMLKPSLAKLGASTSNPDQQATLSQYRSELRDVQTAVNVARGGDTSTAVGLLRASAGQLDGLPTLIHALCKS